MAITQQVDNKSSGINIWVLITVTLGMLLKQLHLTFSPDGNFNFLM